jgi:chromosome segregation ATPase
MLKSIELFGFKSFAKKAQLNFNTPISAIVGPNGSGKSNVAEAFRFVLGEQSIKSLRGKRVEDLIFNGGKEASRANRASAKVVFDNTRRVFDLDFDEISIERVIHRDSVSEYFINGSSVRLKDILELLSSAHIGSSGHHIISQGEADKILNANPKEKREMIEDALGLKIYHYKKEDSQRKLDKTEENIKQVESLRREIAPHLRFLQKQVEKIEKTEQMRGDLKSLYLEYFKREDNYLVTERKNITEAKRIPLQTLARLEEELKQAKEVLDKSSTKDIKSEEIVSLEGQLREVRLAKDLLVREIGRIEGEVSYLDRQYQKQIQATMSVEAKKIDLSTVENLSLEINNYVDSSADSNDLQSLKSVLQKIKSLLQNFINLNKNETDDSLKKEIEQEIAELKQKKNNSESELLLTKTKEADLLNKYQAVKEEIEREKDSNRDAEKAVFRIMAEQNEINTRLATLQNKEDKLSLDEANFKQELTEAGVLVGLEAVRYQDFVLEIVPEDRFLQEDRRKNIERLKIRIEDAGIGSTDEILREYREANERDSFLIKELADLNSSSESLSALIKELDEKLTTEFKLGVDKINNQFQDFFSKMFGGGTARLSVTREAKKKKVDTDLSILEEVEMSDDNPNEVIEGIDIEVNLPKKKVRGLMMLSGGERALTSIALLFAISQVNPPPFIILDETDAALDEANSKKYGDMITELSKYSQLILVTHNRETMSRAGIIYGVTMGFDGASKLLSIQFEEAVEVAK